MKSMNNIAETIQNYNTIYKNFQDIVAPCLCELLYINDTGNWNLNSDDEIFVFYSETDVRNFINCNRYDGPHFFNDNSTHIICIRLQSYENECYEYFTVFIDAKILEADDWIEQLQEKYKSIFTRYYAEYLNREREREDKKNKMLDKEYQQYLKLKEKFKEREMKSNVG